MPIIDTKDVELQPPQALLETYFRSAHGFMLQARRTAELFFTCEDALERARILQLTSRRPWFVGYAAGQNSEAFRTLLIDTLERIGASVTLYRQGSEVAVPPDAIHLTHHSRGRRPGLRHYKMAYLPDFFHLDRLGYSGWSEMAQARPADLFAGRQAEADRLFETEVAALLEARVSKFKQPETGGVEAEGFVFVALQVPNDSVISLCFEPDYVATVTRAIGALLAAGERVVAKPHPFGRTKPLMAALDRLRGQGLILTDGSIHDLLPRAKAVLTANSGVGFEALLRLKPVLCLARADYGHAGREVRDAREAPAVLREAVEGHDPALTRRVVAAALRRYQVNLRSRLSMEQHVLRLLCEMHLGDSPRKQAGDVVHDH